VWFESVVKPTFVSDHNPLASLDLLSAQLMHDTHFAHDITKAHYALLVVEICPPCKLFDTMAGDYENIST